MLQRPLPHRSASAPAVRRGCPDNRRTGTGAGARRAANHVPIWTVSRGKNLGYGTAAPVVAGSIILDLSRMKKIEVDVENATVLLEPGVGFYDLYDYLQTRTFHWCCQFPVTAGVGDRQRAGPWSGLHALWRAHP